MITKYLLYVVLLPLLLQNRGAAVDPAVQAAQEQKAAEFRALLQQVPKLTLQRTDLKATPQPGEWTTNMVSWVAADRNGLIHLLQRSDKADPVVVMDRDGRVLRSWGKGMYTMPHAIRVDRQGNVWTADAASSMVTKFSSNGQKLLEISVGGQPTPCRNNFCGTTDVAFAANGNIFIADGYANARILEYTADGKKVREWGEAGTGPGQFRLPHSIQMDEKGIIYVADRENGRIQRFDMQGKFLGEWPKYGHTYGMKLKPDSIWLSTQLRTPNGNPGYLLKVDRETGKLLGYIEVTGGVHGMEAFDNGELILASPGQNQSPQFFRLPK